MAQITFEELDRKIPGFRGKLDHFRLEMSEITHQNEPNRFGPDYILWHYTNVQGLEGILDSHALWMTKAFRADCNNGSSFDDSSEMLHAMNLIGEKLGSLCPDWYDSEKEKRRQAEDLSAYITCFSVLENSPHIYDNDRPISLGFRLESLRAMASAHSLQSQANFCVYSQPHKEALAELVARQAQCFNAYSDSLRSRAIYYFLGNAIGEALPFFKPEKHVDEREYRVCCQAEYPARSSKHLLKSGNEKHLPIVRITLCPHMPKDNRETVLECIARGPYRYLLDEAGELLG